MFRSSKRAAEQSASVVSAWTPPVSTIVIAHTGALNHSAPSLRIDNRTDLSYITAGQKAVRWPPAAQPVTQWQRQAAGRREKIDGGAGSANPRTPHRPSEILDTLRRLGFGAAIAVPDSWLGEILVRIERSRPCGWCARRMRRRPWRSLAAPGSAACALRCSCRMPGCSAWAPAWSRSPSAISFRC